jgi:hypothetical protein
MVPSFHAYIDESGDEGFAFLPGNKGSSRWFVQSATVFRASNGGAPVRALKAARQVLCKPADYVLHFKNLKHPQRAAYVDKLTAEKFLMVNILSYKPDISDPESYQADAFLLYRYLTRLLLERVSWIARDFYKEGDGDGTVEFTFSDRSAMSYADLRKYVDLMREQTLGDAVGAHWAAIKTDQIKAVQHGQRAGLQFADAVASSAFQAFAIGPYGLPELSYLHMLRKHAYSHKKRTLGYGMKFLSNVDSLKTRMPHVSAALGNW